jgi:hypothetical protein
MLSLVYNISARTTQPSHCRSPTVALLRICCIAGGTCLWSRYPETALIYPPISRSLHNNSSTRYNMKSGFWNVASLYLYTYVCLATALRFGRFLFIFSISEFIHLWPVNTNFPAPEIDARSPKRNANFSEKRSGCFD